MNIEGFNISQHSNFLKTFVITIQDEEEEEDSFDGELDNEMNIRRKLLDSYLELIESAIIEDNFFQKANKTSAFRIVENYVETKWREKNFEDLCSDHNSIITNFFELGDSIGFQEHVRILYSLSTQEIVGNVTTPWENDVREPTFYLNNMGLIPILETNSKEVVAKYGGLLSTFQSIANWVSKYWLNWLLSSFDEILGITFGSSGTLSPSVFIGNCIATVGEISLNLFRYLSGSQNWECTKDGIDSVVGIWIGNSLGAVIMDLIGPALLTALGITPGGFAFYGISFLIGGLLSSGAKLIVGMFTKRYYSGCKESALKSCFNKLGLPRNATIEEIDSAKRQLCRKYHPDFLIRRTPPPTLEEIEEAKKEFNEIQEAYKFIIRERAEESKRAAAEAENNSASKTWWQRAASFFVFIWNFLFNGKKYTQIDEPKNTFEKEEALFWLGEDEALRQFYS